MIHSTTLSSTNPPGHGALAPPSLIFVSLSYGFFAGPEGICGQRLVQAVRQSGVEVQVLSGRTPRHWFRPRIGGDRPLPAFMYRPVPIQAAIGQLLVGAPVSQWDWVVGVASRKVRRPAVVYARGNPLTSLVAGQRLAMRSGLPLIAHFSDPMPSPWENLASRLAVRRMAAVRSILNYATLLTFTTAEAIAYMSHLYAQDLSEKAFLVRNIVPDWPAPLEDTPETREIAYVGDFGGNRSPFALAAGIALFNGRQSSMPLALSMVGTAPVWAREIRARYGASVPIRHVGRTDDPLSYYSRAAISASVDANDQTPVFLATKTAEVAYAARRALIVSPEGSPARRLFAGQWETIQFAAHAPEEICGAIERLLRTSASVVRDELPRRRASLEPFSGYRVAQQLLSQIELRIT